jgi:hypothetical protein
MATAQVAVPTPAIPSSQRPEPGSVNLAIHKFHDAGSSPSDPAGIAAEIVKGINDALAKGDVIALANLFLDDSYWRDHLGLSWDFHTLKGKETISEFLKQNGCPLESIELDTSNAFTSPRVGAFDGIGEVKGVEFFFRYKAKGSTGRGTCRVAEDSDGKSKIFSFFTQLCELEGLEEPLGPRRPNGVQHGGKPDRKNWRETRQSDLNYEDGKEPTVLIVGRDHSAPHCIHDLTFDRCWPSWLDGGSSIENARYRCPEH